MMGSVPYPMFNGYLPEMFLDQAVHFGIKTANMSDEELQIFLAQMGNALFVEVAELIEETQWKPWKATTKDFPIRDTRVKIAEEAVDVLHFLAHILNACGVTEYALNKAMQDKRDENARRQLNKYSY